ncbi:hypothetical protein CC86DRAFT_356666 [Ophiobolus disseminans]|uniref:DUF7728 domain-containing protein n=1 Tax=Ophiobolus disseminans TaxID=1469910 RepID=A0A6A6ZP63_9PLEO|nr:hypothetical protein CC86DRAFT_356666 [Ophiobolus disseminans]
MSLSKLGVFASLALAASAVLIPPTITTDDLGDDVAMEGLVIDPSKRSVALECPGCAFAHKEETHISWKQDAGNTLLLNFETGPHEDILGLNGFQLYPPNFSEAVTSFYVTQVDPESNEPLRLHVTGYEFSFNGAETVSQDGMELLPMNLHIFSLEGVAVEPPILTINVLKEATGRLMIASFDTAQTSETDVSAQDNCNEWPLLCKWKTIVAERIEKMKKMGKPCHKRPNGHHNPMEQDGMAGKPPHRFRPGRPHHRPHHGPHHMGHGHHRMHRFATRALFTILIPIIIGIFAGTVTYLIGMVLGTLIAIVIAKIRGQSYQRIALDEEDIEVQPEVNSEKQGYAELPAYDAPPVYEDAPAAEVGESK